MSLKDAFELMIELGFPAIAVYGPEGVITAVLFAENEATLNTALENPTEWEIWRRKL